MKTSSFNLSLYLNKVVKITIQQNAEVPYLFGTFLALLQYDNTIKGYILNHPYNIKLENIESGIAAFDTNDVIAICPATTEEVNIFLAKYKEFHDSVIASDGVDPCELIPSDFLMDLELK